VLKRNVQSLNIAFQSFESPQRATAKGKKSLPASGKTHQIIKYLLEVEMSSRRRFIQFTGTVLGSALADAFFRRMEALAISASKNRARRRGPWVGGWSGGYHTVALRSDGLVFACGYNVNGRLGDNTTINKSSFVQALGVSNAKAVTGGLNHTVVLRSDGLVFAAGHNIKGQLGDNTTVAKSSFVQALGISNVKGVACWRNNHTVALRSDGLVFACGDNAKGQLGDNTIVAKSSFVQALGISNASAIAGGQGHTVALRSDGLVFVCGQNVYGQLGDNTTVAKSSFVQALGISNAVAVACGYYHTVALRSDGLVFACGYNIDGELGDNTNIAKSTFVRVAVL
jgi:alpha-tubulin suppressor-like RCC1 family protein